MTYVLTVWRVRLGAGFTEKLGAGHDLIIVGLMSPFSDYGRDGTERFDSSGRPIRLCKQPVRGGVDAHMLKGLLLDQLSDFEANTEDIATI